MSTPTKRSLEQSTTPKRARIERIARLCEVAGIDVFSNAHNAAHAKERGYLRNREASAKYEELERKLFTLFKEMGELDFPDEDWCFDVLPELNNLEADTLDALLAQAQQHAKYEHAARALVIHERSKLLDEHETAIRAIRAEAESEATRKNMSSEMKLRQQDDEAHEQQEALRAAANEKIGTLEDSIEELQRTIAQQQKRMDEMESEHAAECDRLRDEGEDAVEAMREAEAETDLKRLASRKLKEEIIDNDRLTVANINRIRHLEALVDQHKAALDEADSENAELRSELERSIEVGHDAKESAEEVATLRDLLASARASCSR